MTDSIAERDAFATAPADMLVEQGIIPHADYADALNPGPQWQADIAKRVGERRRRKALTALGELKADDVAAILAALQCSIT